MYITPIKLPYNYLVQIITQIATTMMTEVQEVVFLVDVVEVEVGGGVGVGAGVVVEKRKGGQRRSQVDIDILLKTFLLISLIQTVYVLK